MNADSSTTPRRGQLLLIASIALLSLGGAYLLYYLAAQGALWGTTNKGTFVDPPLTASAAGVRTSAGASFDTDGRWWLWVVPNGPCGEACAGAVHRLRQLHVLLNRDAARVRRALVLPEGAGGGAELAGQYPRLELLSGNLATLERGIYIVDPLGNLVFHYPLRDAGEPVLDDLKRLLKVSQIG